MSNFCFNAIPIIFIFHNTNIYHYCFISLRFETVTKLRMKSSSHTNAPKSFDDITTLCKIHNELDLFIWVCSRFPDTFVFDQSSLAIQEQIIGHINDGLVNSDDLQLNHCYKERDIRLRKYFAERNE